MPVTINEGTQTDIYTVVNGGTEIQVIKLDVGSGTTLSDFAGSINNVGVIHNAGTVAALPNIPGGTVGEITSVSNLVKGTITRVEGGTVGEVTTVSNLTNGTVRISVGTITTGTLQNLVSGTVNALAAGTITNGTVQTIGIRHPDEFATVVNSGTSVLGTIRAAVTGSAIYVTSCVISVNAPSNVEIASGGTSTPIAGTFFFAGSGGAVIAPIDPPWRTASGSALVYKQSANTGLSLTVTGYID